MRTQEIHRLDAPPPINVEVAHLSPATLLEFGVTPEMTIAGHLEDARRELCEARDAAERNGLDEFRAWADAKSHEISERLSEMAQTEEER